MCTTYGLPKRQIHKCAATQTSPKHCPRPGGAPRLRAHVCERRVGEEHPLSRGAALLGGQQARLEGETVRKVEEERAALKLRG